MSYVLHERSDSRNVQAAARGAYLHGRRTARLRDLPVEIIDHLPEVRFDIWLTVTLGVPSGRGASLSDFGAPSCTQLLLADATPDEAIESTRFFRAPARLNLPDNANARVVVGAHVLRPGGRSTHLKITGVHDWPDERDGVIRSLERLIQPFAHQWFPDRALWDQPAEVLLGDEVR